MAKHSKRLRAAYEAIDVETQYDLTDAIGLIKKAATARFDETVEVSINLGVDPRHADQMVRGVVSMPNGTGKKLRVAVFAKADKAAEALAAGADIVGAEDLMEQVQKGQIVQGWNCIDFLTMYQQLGWVSTPVVP